MASRITIAVAGCGARGQDTYSRILMKMTDRAQIVACADTDPDKLAGMRKMCGVDEAQCYASAEDMLQQPRLADAMLICTPDKCHYFQAKEALLKGYHLLLEKPISPSAEECRELATLAQACKLHVVVCHVLRYTPFYQKVHDIILSGVLGDIAAIQANEQVCYWHQAHSFVRGNWRNKELSSPMILQKCCHDMDILLWLSGKHCKRVSSIGSLMHFRAEQAPLGAAKRCTDDCAVATTCPYNAVRFYMNHVRNGERGWPVNVVAFNPTEESVMTALKEGPYGRCVYACDNDVVDHQAVMLELEDGATVDFTMCAFTAHGGRTLRIMGTHGELLGDMKKETIRVMPYVGEEEEIDVTKLADDFSGHGGGDARMIESFLKLLIGESITDGTLSSIEHSVESHLVAFAAESSRLAGGQMIELSN